MNNKDSGQSARHWVQLDTGQKGNALARDANQLVEINAGKRSGGKRTDRNEREAERDEQRGGRNVELGFLDDGRWSTRWLVGRWQWTGR